MNKICDACEFLKSPKNLIIDTKYWAVGIGNDQPYLGRAYATLKNHKSKISELNNEEWAEFKTNIGILEIAYKNAFGADTINIECNMNHAFKFEPYNPHVHWHIYPRYKTTPKIAGIKFDDPLFGSHIDENLKRVVSNEVVEEIVLTMRQNI